MKISNKVLLKILILLIFLGLVVLIASLFIDMAYQKYYYKYYSDPEIIDELISKDYGDFRINKHNSKYPGSTHIDFANHEYGIKYLKNLIKSGYDLNSNGEIEDEEFYQGQYTHYMSYSKKHYQTYKIETIGVILLILVSISIFIIILIYFTKINKLTKITRKYINYILATSNNKLENISKEFGESIETVETNIEKSINKNILKNAYLSKQTKEILIINCSKKNRNIQNVNVENNVIVENKKD